MLPRALKVLYQPEQDSLIGLCRVRLQVNAIELAPKPSSDYPFGRGIVNRSVRVTRPWTPPDTLHCGLAETKRPGFVKLVESAKVHPIAPPGCGRYFGSICSSKDNSKPVA